MKSAMKAWLSSIILLAGCIPRPDSGQTVPDGTNNGGAVDMATEADAATADASGNDSDVAAVDMAGPPRKFYEHRVGLVLDPSSGWSSGSALRELANHIAVGFKAEMILGSPAELAGMNDLDLIVFPQFQSYSETSTSQLRLDDAPLMTMGTGALASLGLFEGIATGSVSELFVDPIGVHPALGGLTAGPYKFMDQAGFQTHENPAPGGEVAAIVAGNATYGALVTFETGAELFEGTAAARRVFMPYRSFASFTGDGWHVFDHSAWWAMDVEPPSTGRFRCHMVATLTSATQDFRHVALRLRHEGCDVTFVERGEVSTIGASDLIVVAPTADEVGIGEVLREHEAPVLVFHERAATVQDLGLVSDTDTVETDENDWVFVDAPQEVVDEAGGSDIAVGPGFTRHEGFPPASLGPETIALAVTATDGLVTALAIESGQMRADGGVAPARRVAVTYTLVNGVVTDAGYSPSPSGLLVVDAAIRWALGTL